MRSDSTGIKSRREHRTSHDATLGILSAEAAVTHIVVIYSQSDAEQQAIGIHFFTTSQVSASEKDGNNFFHVVSAARCSGDSLHSGKLYSGCEVPHSSLRGVLESVGFL